MAVYNLLCLNQLGNGSESLTFLFEGENVLGIKFWEYTGEKTE